MKKHILHSLDSSNVVSSASMPVVASIIIGTLVLGGLTGYGVHFFTSGAGSNSTNITTASADADQATGSSSSAGIKDADTFPDQAEGTLREGGFEGEGSFHLERPGGESQNVYLTSTTVDLTEFLGKEVAVWGKTFDAEKAGWLMDVGYIEVK